MGLCNLAAPLLPSVLHSCGAPQTRSSMPIHERTPPLHLPTVLPGRVAGHVRAQRCRQQRPLLVGSNRGAMHSPTSIGSCGCIFCFNLFEH